MSATMKLTLFTPHARGSTYRRQLIQHQAPVYPHAIDHDFVLPRLFVRFTLHAIDRQTPAYDRKI